MPFWLLAGLVLSIPSIDGLEGGDFAAAAIDLQTGEILLESAGGMDSGQEGRYSGRIGRIAGSLGALRLCLRFPPLRLLLGSPDMGEGHASAVARGWGLYGLVESGPDGKSFLLVALSPEGRELGLFLLGRDLCCEGRADLALMMLWRAFLDL